MNSGLIAFDTVARINRINVDLRAISRESGLDGQVSPDELLRIAKQSGFKAKAKNIPLDQLVAAYPLPAIAHQKDGRYQVLLKADLDRKRVLVFAPETKKISESASNEFEASVENYIILRHKKISSQVVFGFRWFWLEIVRFKRIIGEVLLGSFMVQLFGLVTPLFTQVILDKVIMHRSLTTLDVLAVAFLAVCGFELLLNISRNYIFIHTASKLDVMLGAKLFKHLLALPFMYFESRRVGAIAARVRELDTIREFITQKAVGVSIDLVFSLVFVVVMMLYSVRLTFIVLGITGLIGVIYMTLTPELRRRLEQKFQMAAASHSYLVESVTGVQTVKSLALEGAMQRRWEDQLAAYIRAGFRLASMSSISGAVAGALRQLMTISILFLGVRLVLINELTIGQLIAFQMFSGQFVGPVLRLVNLWNETQQALLSVDRLGDILNHPLEMPLEKAITLPELKGAIRLDQVSFSYSAQGIKAIDGLSFVVRQGMSVGIVGKSGSGKSTLAKLLQRLYLPTEGAIYIDDVDVRHLNPLWLRAHIGVVLQENYLFSGTIRENIALPKPDAPMEHILRAASLAGAHEFIASLPEGYDTLVSERGSSLSGGQRQRIAIARALITNPRILIFDEATSSLDYESEKIIRANLKSIKQGRTTILIAHRLSNVKDCDVIFVLDKGRLVEAGTHEKLIEAGGYYCHFHAQQE
jgi:ATP-binding cassette, subfamily B, bacterial HlyB/CyaB